MARYHSYYVSVDRFAGSPKWLTNYPKDLVIPFDRWLNSGMGFLITYFGWFFRGVSWLLEWPIDGVRIVLQSLPWAVLVS